ncbi:MAG: hypothetical protein WC070_01695 [Candidatus Magasanikbacteria bacterium]
MKKLTPQDEYLINEIRGILKNRRGSIEEFKKLEEKVVVLSEKAQKFLQSKNSDATDIREEAFSFLLQMLHHIKRDGVFSDKSDDGTKVRERINQYLYAHEFLKGRFEIDGSFEHRVDFRKVKDELWTFLDWVKSECSPEDKNTDDMKREGSNSEGPRVYRF